MAIVALVGRPNVGKSSLFNRMVGKAMALVDDTPGLTRDRKTAEVVLDDITITLVDTPGLEQSEEGSITDRMQKQTETAVRDADLVLFVVDAHAGVTPNDRYYAKWLRKFDKKILLVVNKCDGKKFESGLNEAYQLGFGQPFAVSASHNENVGDLKTYINDTLAEDAPDEDTVAADLSEESLSIIEDPDSEEQNDAWRKKPLHLAIVGRPNAGKSTLVNALLGEERMLTGPEAGLTRDSVHLPFTYKDRAIRLVDTAGLRRKARINDRLEKMSVDESLRTIRLAHLVVLVVDATQALEAQDLTIARLVVDEGRALIVAVNKWDLVEDKAAVQDYLEDKISTSLTQAKAAPMIMMSALKGKNLDKLMKAVLETEEVWNQRCGTSKLNRWLAAATERNPPPMIDGRRLKIRYATQIKTRPPTFALWVNKAGQFPEFYLKYLTNTMREQLKLPGVPIRFVMKKSSNPYADKKGDKK